MVQLVSDSSKEVPPLAEMKKLLADHSEQYMRVFPAQKDDLNFVIFPEELCRGVLCTSLTEKRIGVTPKQGYIDVSPVDSNLDDSLNELLQKQLRFLGQFENVWTKTREERRELFDAAPKEMKALEVAATEKLREKLTHSEQLLRNLQDQCSIWHYNHQLQVSIIGSISKKLASLETRVKKSTERAISLLEKASITSMHAFMPTSHSDSDFNLLESEQKFKIAEQLVKRVVWINSVARGLHCSFKRNIEYLAK